MFDPAAPMRPTPLAVREASESLKQAIDAHLFAVETRLGDSDVAVELAYRDIREATKHYDRLLLEAYNEVTPFMFMDDEGEEPATGAAGESEPAGSQLPGVVRLCLRRDYAVVDPQALMDNGQQAHAAARQAGLPLYEQQPPQNLAAALYSMFQVAGVDGLDTVAAQAGMMTLGGAVWFMEGEDPQIVDVETAFDDLDPERVIFRVHEVPEDGNPEQSDDNALRPVVEPLASPQQPTGSGSYQRATSADPSAAPSGSAGSKSGPARTPWSFDTNSIPVVAADASAPPSPARTEQPRTAPYDPLDTTQAFVWQDETSWAMPSVPIEPGLEVSSPPTSSANQAENLEETMQWQQGLFRDEPAAMGLGEDNSLPTWDPDDPLGDKPRRRKPD